MYDCGTHKVGWRLCFDYRNLKNLKNFAIKACNGESDGLSNHMPMWFTAQKSLKC